MTAVVLAGDFPSTGILQATLAYRVGLDGGDEACAAFIDHVAYALGQRGAVLVVYPSWKGERARRMVRLARSALLTDRVAGVPLDVPPLALSLIADQLAFASGYARPGVLASLAGRLSESVYAGAWVNSVARMEHIKTGLGAHVSSYLPGNAFSVSAGPRPAVHRITASKPVPEPAVRPADPVLMLFGHENGDVEWLQHRLRPVIGAVSVTAVAAQPMSAQYWGTRKYAEFVAFSGHPQALQSLLAGSPYRPCGWCGEPTALPECPFCLMVQPGPEAAPAPGPPAGPSRPPAPRPGQAGPVQAEPARPPSAQPPPSGPAHQDLEAPPTRPQPSPPAGERSPQWPRALDRRDPHAATPVQAEEELAAPTRREPVLAAPVGPPHGAEGDGSGRRDDRTRVQNPPSSWGKAAPPDARPADAAVPAAEPADAPEPADAETDAAEPPPSEPPPSEGTSSIGHILNGGAEPPAGPPRRTAPDDDWPRAGTVGFRPRQPR